MQLNNLSPLTHKALKLLATVKTVPESIARKSFLGIVAATILGGLIAILVLWQTEGAPLASPADPTPILRFRSEDYQTVVELRTQLEAERDKAQTAQIPNSFAP